MYWPQKFSRCYHYLLRSTDNAGGQGNPFSAIGVNAKSATNFRSSSAMRGAEIHGNTRHDSPTHICSIAKRALEFTLPPLLSVLEILVSGYKLARSQFSLWTSVNRISTFIIFLNYLLDHV